MSHLCRGEILIGHNPATWFSSCNFIHIFPFSSCSCVCNEIAWRRVFFCISLSVEYGWSFTKPFVFNLYTCKEWVQVLSFAQLRNTQLFHSKCNYLKCRLTLKCINHATLKIRYIIFIWSMELRDDLVLLSLTGLVAELPFFYFFIFMSAFYVNRHEPNTAWGTFWQCFFFFWSTLCITQQHICFCLTVNIFQCIFYYFRGKDLLQDISPWTIRLTICVHQPFPCNFVSLSLTPINFLAASEVSYRPSPPVATVPPKFLFFSIASL